MLLLAPEAISLVPLVAQCRWVGPPVPFVVLVRCQLMLNRVGSMFNHVKSLSIVSLGFPLLPVASRCFWLLPEAALIIPLIPPVLTLLGWSPSSVRRLSSLSNHVRSS